MNEPSAPLKIAVYHDLPSGGAKRTVHAQVRELVERGHRVECFVTSTGEEGFLPLTDVAHELTTFSVPEPPDRERTLAGRPSPGDLVRWIGVYRGIRRAGRETASALDRDGFDVLLVHPSQFTQAPHLLQYASIPSVYYCHEVLRAAYEPSISTPFVRFVIRMTLGRVDRRNARSASTIATNSEYTARRVREVYGRTSTVVHPGVDTDRFRPLGEAREEYLLAVGALHPLKGMDFVIDAVGRLPADEKHPLIIISDRIRDQERVRIRKRAAALDVKVELRHRVTEEELIRLYGRARCVLFASHREPLGLVPVEAMACGTPIVAVAEGGVSESVLDRVTGFLTSRDTDEFASRIVDILDRPELAERMGMAGRRHVEEHWTWQRSVDDLEALMRRTATTEDGA